MEGIIVLGSVMDAHFGGVESVEETTEDMDFMSYGEELSRAN